MLYLGGQRNMCKSCSRVMELWFEEIFELALQTCAPKIPLMSFGGMSDPVKHGQMGSEYPHWCERNFLNSLNDQEIF